MVGQRFAGAGSMSLEFTNNWFEATARSYWEQLIPQLNPRRILEIGSFEGASTCFLIEKLARADSPLQIHCVDTWQGGIEHQPGAAHTADMDAVEARFNRNIRAISEDKKGMKIAITIHKSLSYKALSTLIQQGHSDSFDFIYVDGSHQAPDVLTDAVMSFYLLKKGGVIAFDDYLWSEHTATEREPLRCPKPAIDAFSNIFFRKVAALRAPLGQMYLQKTGD